jgi:hypothetical protein
MQHCDILSLVLSPSFVNGDLLKFKIVQHHDTVRQCFGNNITTAKCKFHYLLHHGDLLNFYGPLANYWTVRFEACHQTLKKIARYSTNFKNITLTLTKGFYSKMIGTLASNSFSNKITTGPVENLTLNEPEMDLLSHNIQNILQTNCFPVTSKLHHNGLTFEVNDVLVIKPFSKCLGTLLTIVQLKKIFFLENRWLCLSCNVHISETNFNHILTIDNIEDRPSRLFVFPFVFFHNTCNIVHVNNRHKFIFLKYLPFNS